MLTDVGDGSETGGTLMLTDVGDGRETGGMLVLAVGKTVCVGFSESLGTTTTLLVSCVCVCVCVGGTAVSLGVTITTGDVTIAVDDGMPSSVVVVGTTTSGPVSVGAAYGGSNKPNRPHALHGYAQELTCLGAARTGLQRGSGAMVAMAPGATDLGQSVPMSERVSCCVAPVEVSPTMVETWLRSSGRIQSEVAGPKGAPAVSVPTAVGMSMYTEGDVNV